MWTPAILGSGPLAPASPPCRIPNLLTDPCGGALRPGPLVPDLGAPGKAFLVLTRSGLALSDPEMLGPGLWGPQPQTPPPLPPRFPKGLGLGPSPSLPTCLWILCGSSCLLTAGSGRASGQPATQAMAGLVLCPLPFVFLNLPTKKRRGEPHCAAVAVGQWKAPGCCSLIHPQPQFPYLYNCDNNTGGDEPIGLM